MSSTVYISTITIDDQTGGWTATSFIPLDRLQTYSTTLLASQTINAGVVALVTGTLTIPDTLTLTINGLLQISNTIFQG